MWIEVRQWLFFSNFVSWPSSYVNMQISFRTITDEKRILGSLFNLFCICLSSKWMCVTLKIKRVQLQKCKKIIFRCPELEGYALSKFVNSSGKKEPRTSSAPLEKKLELIFFVFTAHFARVFLTILPKNEVWNFGWKYS